MNRILTIAALLMLAAWGAAQFVDVAVNYPYRPVGIYLPKVALYHRFLWCNAVTSGVQLAYWQEDGGAITCPYERVSVRRARWGPQFDFGYRPRWSTSRPIRSLFVPYWMLATAPALLLAWRLRRARRHGNTRGFEVAAA